MKRTMTVGSLLAVGLIGLLGASPGPAAGERKDQAESAAANGDSRIQVGFDIAPVPLSYSQANRSLVGLGSYLVNATGGCNDCHTAAGGPFEAGGNPYFGQPEHIDADLYLVGGTTFGPFVSRNLRPDPDTGLPAGLTFAQFLEVMRHGTDFDDDEYPPPNTPILQVMPWPVFGNMTRRDLRAIYEYLRALPPVADEE